MKKEAIKRHLKPYSIFTSRHTTINHAFSSALAMNDEYDESLIDQSLKLLGQDPSKDLICFFCGGSAETWDHVNGIVKKGLYSGFGHVIRNLVPCCHTCNSSKGQRNYRTFLLESNRIAGDRQQKIKVLEKYTADVNRVDQNEIRVICTDDMVVFEHIQSQILYLMKKADEIAEKIRNTVRAYRSQA